MRTVLIIEDEYDIVSTLAMVFEAEGYEVQSAFNGREALQILREPPAPDLILCDMMMPLMNGYQFLQELDKLGQFDHVPVVLMSAAPLQTSQLGKRTTIEFVRKPFDLDQMLAQVKKTLLGKEGNNA